MALVYYAAFTAIHLSFQNVNRRQHFDDLD